MKIISRYLTVEIGKQFAIILIAVVGIYLAVDFIEKVDDFMDAGVPMQRALIYFTYKLPLVLSQITPVAILLCSTSSLVSAPSSSPRSMAIISASTSATLPAGGRW